MRKKFVFATNNSHKLEEVTAILGEKVELLSMKDIKCDTDIPETADTLEGNALLKARYIFDNYHLDCFPDDTGDRKSTRLNSSHYQQSRMPSSA